MQGYVPNLPVYVRRHGLLGTQYNVMDFDIPRRTMIPDSTVSSDVHGSGVKCDPRVSGVTLCPPRSYHVWVSPPFRSQHSLSALHLTFYLACQSPTLSLNEW